MAGGAKKATKKFQKNRLKDTLDNRKEFKKIKQSQQLKAKKKARRNDGIARARTVDEPEKKTKGQSNGATNDLSKMSVDEFFQGGFEVPEIKKIGKSSAKVTGKRKRGSDEASASSSVEGSESENASDASGSEADLGAHKKELEALAGKDPEFYSFLKENDAELLDFDDDGDLGEIEELSEDHDKAVKKAKTKQESSALTKATVQKWKTAIKGAIQFQTPKCTMKS